MFLSLYALLLRMLVIDLHAKNQHNICKGTKKSLENYSIGEIHKVKGTEFREKSMRCNETPTRSVSHDDLLTCQKSAQYLKAFRKKLQKTV